MAFGYWHWDIKKRYAMSFNLIFDAKFHDVNFVRDWHDDMESLIDFMIHDTF